MENKPLIILQGGIKSPPFSEVARKKAGFLLRRLQRHEMLSLPESRPMPSIGPRCHELRVKDPMSRITWRVVYRLDTEAVLIVDVFAKKTQQTSDDVIWRCKSRLKNYDEARKHL